jgi:RimJ/RimL family protein N-acetyltransferase
MIPVAPLGPRTLAGRFVMLEPLAPAHDAALTAIAADPALWEHVPFDPTGGFAAKLSDLHRAMAAGTQLVYVVRRLADGALVGSTSYMALAPEHARVEIGSTWYIAEAQGTAVNPEAKLLLLENAFACGYHRVELKTDARNARSRAAILKLGATEEGTLRSHMWMPQGRFRDTVYFSILAEEWPAARERLERRLSAFS